MDLIFTDLDGTLLDRDTYTWDAAKPAIASIRRRGIPWVLVSSKTRAEIEFWRAEFGNEHPFIVENGGAAFIPAGYYGCARTGGRRDGPYDVLEWGTPSGVLIAELKEASRVSRCPVRGFSEMTVEDVALCCGLPLHQAALAKQREFGEPFLVLAPERAEALAAAITARGLRWTRGGRFWHILGANDKAVAVQAVTRLFAQENAQVRTIGLGDALNDAPFLQLMDVAVIIQSPQAGELKRLVPHGVVTGLPGPAGWNDSLLRLIGG